MVIIDRAYAGGAVKTVVSGSMTPTVPGAGGTFTVADATGWPSTGKMAIKLNAGLSDEEHIVVDSRSGTTFTVGQRGADGTNAQAHDNPTCELYFDARSAQLMVDHVDDVEADPHSTKLLNNARHDVTARHTYGAALGTRPTPVSVGTANAAGSGSAPAAGDHVHDIANGAIDSAALFAAGVVDQAAIANNAVGSGEIIDLAVITAKLNDLAVTTAKLADAAVTQAKLANGLYVPIGGAVVWFDATVPTNWFILNGQAISRATYATLFALWGTDFGAGDGSTTFNIPDVRQRFLLGVAASGTGNTLGGTGGTINHVHGLDSSSSYARITAASGSTDNAWMDRKNSASWNSTLNMNWGGTGGEVTANTSGASLGGNSDTADPPFMAVHYIVRAL